MISILKEHLIKYPEMQPQDAVKLVFQATFGANHLIEDKESSLIAIEKEWVKREDISPFENIGGGFCRAYINAFEKEELALLNKLFVLGASPKEGELNLKAVAELFGEEYVAEYLKEGIRPVSHSDIYKENYKPAYRVIPKVFADNWAIFKKIYFESPRVIAIDGRAGSGKTTLANAIAKVFGAGVVRADDFFLPPVMRTENRLLEPGGNIHYERLKEQVIDKLGAPFEYEIFDCSVMAVNGKKKIENTGLVVVEGSYCMHPYFGRYFDLGIFLSVSKEEQEARILKRNGGKMLEMFKSKWIPMEEKYISHFKIEDIADIACYF